jgi:uncharacterized membrane protein
MKKLTFLVTAVIALAMPSLAQAETQVCTQVYGGGVVCGVHTVVNTGLGENLAFVGFVLIASSVFLHFFAKKLQAGER